MKYLYLARLRGCRVVVVNPYLEPGLDRYWVPSNAESALFGTKMCDLHVPVRPGWRRGLRLRRPQAADRAGRRRRRRSSPPTPIGWDDLVADLDERSLEDLLDEAGLTRAQVEEFVDEYAAADAAILLWSMGITQHRELGRRRAGHREPGPGPRQRRPRRGRPHAAPRPLGRAGRGRDGGLRHGLPRGHRDQRAHRPRSWPTPGASRCPTTRAAPLRRCSKRPRRRARRAVELGRQLPRRAARSGPRSRPRSTGCRCGSTRTSCSARRCWCRATTSSCCRWPRATSRRAAAPRPPPSAASCSAPRSPARSARPAASGACSPTWPPGSAPS